MNNRIYLDYNATTPVKPGVTNIMSEIMALPYNASAVHSFGREGRRLVEQARSHIGALTGAPDTQVIFNSGATEGNNTVLQHFAKERVLVSALEHPSVLDVLPKAERIPATPAGTVDLNELEHLLKQTPRAGLVSAMLVNNETGVIQPIEDIANLAHKHGALLHCDGVQAAGRIPLDIQAMGIDFLTLSAHKLGGPQGTGALVLGLCGITPTLIHGGGQEKKARAGTENVAAIAGFGEAAISAHRNLDTYTQTLAPLQTMLEKKLSDIMINNESPVVIHGQKSPRVVNTTLFSLPGLKSETALMALDLEGIAVSNGAACSSGTVQASHVLNAMRCGPEIANSALRISTGWNTQKQDINVFLEKIVQIYVRIRTS